MKTEEITDEIIAKQINSSKKAEEWYERSVKPRRRKIQQDICAWEKDDDARFKEVITLGFFHGYMQASEEMNHDRL